MDHITELPCSNGAIADMNALVSKLVDAGIPQEELQEIKSLANGDPMKLRRLLVRKRFGEPNAHLRGHVSMMGRNFNIDRRCYIPDTYCETLASHVLRNVRPNSSILEVGTGCGWMSITIKLERPDLTVIACDIDPNALQLARENAERHCAEITLHESHFVDDLDISAPDYIVANMPYGGDAEYTAKELEERPQMPPISVFDPEGTAKPLIDLNTSIINKNWSPVIFSETGYLDKKRLAKVFEQFPSTKHFQEGEYAFVECA